MVGNNLVAPGSIPPSAWPPASRKNHKLWFSSPASPVEHNSEQWWVESSLDFWKEYKLSHFVFLCPCWFSILSSHFMLKKLWKSCVLLEAFRRILSLMIALCRESSFRLSWARSSSVQASTEGFNLESLAFLTPSTPKGDTTVKQLCHKEFAKSLILPCYYFWWCIVEGWVHLFCKQTRESSKKIRSWSGT